MGWLIVTVIAVAVSGCSFGVYVDRLDDGTQLDVQYKKRGYSEKYTGMDFAPMNRKESLKEQAVDERNWASVLGEK
jgi:hypothetical protein